MTLATRCKGLVSKAHREGIATTRLQNGLSIVVDHRNGRRRVAFGRQTVYPSANEIRLCTEHIPIPSGVEPRKEVRNGYCVIEFTWDPANPPAPKADRPIQPPLALELAPIVPVNGTRDLSIDERFIQFHTANPHVYQLLRELALQLARSGMEKFGVKLLYERLRWEYALRTSGEPFRLNNSLTSRYARLLADNEPVLADRIETRALRS